MYHFSVLLHILAATAWFGGAIFLVVALMPVLRKPDYRDQLIPLLKEVGGRFRTLGWVSLVILIVTGFINLYYRKWLTAGSAFWGTSIGMVLMIKMTLVAIILMLSMVHDFVIGGAAVKAWEEDPGSEKTRKLRATSNWIGRVNMLLTLIVIALAVALVRGMP